MKIKLALFFIVLLALLLRLWSLSSFPSGFSADEATIGYNAYSVLRTGKDEYGELLPLAFKAFSDYQAPLYTYFTVPVIATLGLNEVAVRLPSAIFGVATVIIIYFLILKLFQEWRIALLTSFFLTISPWHIFFSRGAWQTNLATFWMALGIYFFILGLERGKFLIFSVLAFVASMYSYQSPRLIVPIFAVLLFVFYARQLLKQKKFLVGSLVIGFVVFIPLIFILTGPAGQARFKGVSIFTDLGPLNRINQDRGEHSKSNGFVAKLFHNKAETYLNIFFRNYSDHFGPKFLLTDGDPIGRQNIPEMGVMYLFDAVLLPLGLLFVLQKDRLAKAKIILLWLVIAPVASAITFQTPNALRAANMAVPLSIISSFGVVYVFNYLSTRNVYIKNSGFLIAGLATIFFFAKFLHQYYIHLPQKYGLEWEYGFGKMIKSVEKNQDQYSKVVITNRYDQPYILTLFYLHFDPKTYQRIPKKETEIDEFGFTTISSFGKYEFRKISQEEIKTSKNVLFVATSEEIPQNIPSDVIYFPNGQIAFKIIKT